MKLLCSILLLFSLNQGFAHEYYFAFAEAQFNHTTQKIELSVTVSTHDIEHWLQDNGIKIKELENHYEDSLIVNEISTQLLHGIHFSILEKNINFKIIGFQVNKNGLTDFFFISEEVKVNNEIKVTFDLLMDKYKGQQNKLTFIYNSRKMTFPFLPTQREQIIHLDTFNE
ncbi:MAG: hypothetical protein HYR91_06310 [Flavobacteriia bacterium]|nr:hypothetical protein [Flavobacteriia bacterium]